MKLIPPPWFVNMFVWVITWVCMAVAVGTVLYVLLHYICLCIS